MVQQFNPNISQLKTEDDILEECDISIELDVSHLVTEDDTPVDNFASEKQQRLLTSALYSSKQGEIFIVAANVGIYHTYHKSPIVPNVFLSLGVQVAQNWWEKSNRCYFVWEFGKPPEVVIEIVSNKEGGELDKKLQIYEQMRVSYYVVYDPNQQLGETNLHIFELKGIHYLEITVTWLEQVGLGLTIWQGEFEGSNNVWLRWCDQKGNILLTGDERAKQAEQRAQEAERRAQKLAEQLRALGVEPHDL